MEPRSDTPLERRYLAFLAEVGVVLGEPLPYEATLQRVCDAAVRTVADVATMYLYDENDELQVVAAAHVISERSERLRYRAIALLNDPKGPRWWFESIIRDAKGLLIPHIDAETLGAAGGSPQFVQFIVDTGVRSFMIVPLVALRGVLGALALVYTDYNNMAYDADAFTLAQDLGRRCGAAIAKAKLHETAVDVSTRFQHAALPKSLPVINGLALDSFYEPASSEMLVGGDWFDAFELPDGRLGISVGDIAGHGVEAAAFMGSVRDALRIAMYLECDIDRVLNAADALIRSEGIKAAFATAAICIVDRDARTITFAAAGHPGPLIWDPQQKRVFDPFRTRGLPLGFRDLVPLEPTAETIEFSEGSFAVFFTDGLVEGERDYLRSESLLFQAVAERAVREAANPARAIRDAVAPDHHADDLAILTVRVTASPLPV